MTRMLRHPKQDLVDELHKSEDSPKRIFPILLGSKRYLYFFIAVFESSNETFFCSKAKGSVPLVVSVEFLELLELLLRVPSSPPSGREETTVPKCGVPSNQLRSVKTP